MASILVVDDDLNTLILLPAFIQHHLIELGFGRATIYTASSGDEAIEFMETLPIDLLITDYYMRGTNGLAVINKTRKGKHRVAILMSTDTSLLSHIAGIPNTGVYATLEKPIPQYDLKKILQAVFTEPIDVKQT